MLEEYKGTGVEAIKEATARFYPPFEAGGKAARRTGSACDKRRGASITKEETAPFVPIEAQPMDQVPAVEEASPQPPMVNEQPAVDLAQANKAQRVATRRSNRNARPATTCRPQARWAKASATITPV